MTHSDEMVEISAAVIEARKMLRSLRKTAKGAYAEYADLPEVLDVITKPLHANDLAIMQSPSMDPVSGYCTLTTLLVHAKSGQWIESALSMKPELDKGSQGACQAVGSCISYARRYSLAALFALAQADNDAEGATDTALLPNKSTPKKEKGEWVRAADIPIPTNGDVITIVDVIPNDGGKGPAFRVQTNAEIHLNVDKKQDLYDMPGIWEEEIALEAKYARDNGVPVGIVMESKPGTKPGKTFKTIRAIQVKGRPCIPETDSSGRSFESQIQWAFALTEDDIPF